MESQNVMSISKMKTSLADKIADVLRAHPANFDDESGYDNTSAKLVDDTGLDINEDEEQLISQFRKQNIDFLADVDERYAGEKGSRSITEAITDDDEPSNGSTETEESNDVVQSSQSYDSTNDEMESGSEQDEADTDEESGNIDEESDVEDETPENSDSFRHLRSTDVASHITKGNCVRNQISMWESLLELRIQLQKCLVTGNKMPKKEYFNEIKQQSGSEFMTKCNETKNSLCEVLDKLLQLQSLVLKKYPETKNLHKLKMSKDEHSDEEIPSNTEDELSDVEETKPQKKRLKLSEYEKELSERHDQYKQYRNSVIEKWNTKTRIAIMNNPNSHSVINQIEHNLRDRPKLIKRTQLKRSEYHILGQEDIKNQDQDNNTVATDEYNPEIFDDDDFYHQLLRELIEVKSADITDPLQLGRQWIQLQNMRSKMKRKIDTRATKGRKIRYTVHSKLVNFMAPVEDNQWTDEAKTELYNSLFGKTC